MRRELRHQLARQRKSSLKALIKQQFPRKTIMKILSRKKKTKKNKNKILLLTEAKQIDTVNIFCWEADHAVRTRVEMECRVTTKSDGKKTHGAKNQSSNTQHINTRCSTVRRTDGACYCFFFLFFFPYYGITLCVSLSLSLRYTCICTRSSQNLYLPFLQFVQQRLNCMLCLSLCVCLCIYLPSRECCLSSSTL